MSTSSGSSPLGNLVVRVEGDSSPLEESLHKMEGSVAAFVTHVGESTAGLAAAFGIAVLGEQAFEAAEKFEKATFAIERATGATGASLEGLEEVFKNVYATTGQSADAVAGALSQLTIRTGLTGEELEKLATTNIHLTKVMGGDLKSNIEQTQKLFTQWGVTVDEQPFKLDKLTVASQKTGVNFQTLVGDMTASGASLRTLGYDFDQSAALIAKFDQSGIGSQKIMAALSTTMAKLSTSFKDPNAELRNLMERMQAAPTVTEALRMAVADGLSKKGVAPLTDALRLGVFDIGEITKAMDNSKGTVDDLADKTKSLGDRWKIFQHVLEEALLPLGKPLVEALTNGADRCKALVKEVQDGVNWFGALPGPVRYGAAAIVALPIAIELAVSAFETLMGLKIVSWAIALPGMIANIGTALTSNMVPALLAGESMLLRFGAAGLAIAGSILVFDQVRDIFTDLKAIFPATTTGVDKLNKVYGGLASEGLKQAQTEQSGFNKFLDELQKKFESTDWKGMLTGPFFALKESIHSARVELERLDGDNQTFMDKQVGTFLPKLVAWNDAYNHSIAEQDGGFKKLGETQKAAADLYDRLNNTIKTHVDITKELAKAYNALGIETKHLEEVQAGLALIFRQNTSGPLPQNFQAAAALIELYQKGKITFEQFTQSMIHTGQALLKGLPKDKLAPDIQALFPPVKLRETADAFTQLGLISDSVLLNTARLAREAYHQIAADGNSSARDVGLAFIKWADAEMAVGHDLSQADINRYVNTRAEIGRTIDTVGTLGTAYKQLGIVSDETLKNTAEESVKAYMKILASGTATPREIAKGFVDMSNKLVAVGKVLSEDEIEHYQKMKEAATTAIDSVRDDFKKLGITSDEVLGQQAIDAMNAYNAIASSGTASAHDILVAFIVAIEKSIVAGTTLDASWVEKFRHMKEEAARSSDSIYDAFKHLGISSSATLKDLADRAIDNYNKIRDSGTSSAFDIDRAWLVAVDDQVKAGEKLSLMTALQYEYIKQRVNSSVTGWTSVWLDSIKQITGRLSGDLSHALGDVIFRTGKIGDDFKKMGESVVTTILDVIIKKGINVLMERLLGLGSALSSSATTAVGSAGGAAGSAAGGAASGAGGAASGVAGGLMSSILGWANLGVSVLSGIVQGVEGARTNNLLGEIEVSTRYAWLALGSGETSIAGWTHQTVMTLTGMQTTLWEMRGDYAQMIDNLQQILAQIKSVAKMSASVVTGGNASVNFHANSIVVNGSDDPRAVAEQVARAIPRVLKSRSANFITQPA